MHIGALQDKGAWRKRCNHELCKLFNEPVITKYIKINRLSWAGYIARKKNRTVKKMFQSRPDGARKTGRRGWCDPRQQGRTLGVKNGRKVVMHRGDWLKLLKKAGVHTGLSSQ
jgi:hypothetical protein